MAGEPQKRSAGHSASDSHANKKFKSKDYASDKPVVPTNMTRKEKKELDRARKAARNKNFNLIQEVVGHWEDFRRQDIQPEKRSQLVSLVLKKVTGRIAELAGSHTCSRVIQALVKYGTDKERAVILKELEPKLIELSKSPYGHFVISKLVDTATKAQLTGSILKQFKGHASELLRHPAGTHVLNDVYSKATPQQRNAMAAEFYGREYTLFEGGTLNNTKGPPSKLADLLKSVESAKKRSIIHHLVSSLSPVIEKGLVDSQLAHRLVAEYLTHAPGTLVVDAVESLSGDTLLHMVHTKEGASAACMVLAYGTAKDRKKALKSMKGHAYAMATDEWGHLVVMTALSVVDDTATLKKFIGSELQAKAKELISHRYGHRVVLQLIRPNCPRYLPPTLLAIVAPPEKIVDGAAAQIAANGKAKEAAGEGSDSEDDDDDNNNNNKAQSGPLGVSKKDNDVRRKEVLQGGLGTALATACSESAKEFLSTQFAADVVGELCAGGSGTAVSDALTGSDSLDTLHTAVVTLLSQPKDDDNEHVLVNFFGSRALRRLVLASTEDPVAGQFVNKAWADAFKGNCKQWFGSHADKVLAALVQCGDADVKAAASKELAKLMPKGTKIDEWVGKFIVNKKK